jgi:hypothetical protein
MMQKFTLLILISIKLLICNINAQDTGIVELNKNKVPKNSLLSSKQVETITTFYENITFPDGIRTFKDTVSINSLKKIARMYYESDETDAVGTKKLFMNEIEKTTKKYKLKKSNLPIKDFCSPGFTKGRIEELMRKNLPGSICTLVEIPYFLKVKIAAADTGWIKEPLRDTIYTKFLYFDIKAVVEDPIKGGSRFTPGDNLTFYFLPFWIKSSKFDFEIGKTYFLPINISSGNGNYDWLPIALLDNTVDGSSGCFPIEEGYVIDRKNYFGFGERVPWEEFRNNLIKQINTIKSW